MTTDPTPASFDLFERLFATETGRSLMDRFEANSEKAQQAFFRTCKDGWRIAYSTSRVQNGPDDGKFVCLAYKPVGPGARSGKTAVHWKLAYRRAFSTRRAARARAEALWFKHEGRDR